MGALFEFFCNGCGYSATVAGGPSALMAGPTLTIACGACRELYDVVCWDENSSAAVEGGGAWAVANPRPAHRPTTASCPEATNHSVVAWSSPGPCPRCGAVLEGGEGEPILAD